LAWIRNSGTFSSATRPESALRRASWRRVSQETGRWDFKRRKRDELPATDDHDLVVTAPVFRARLGQALSDAKESPSIRLGFVAQ
jgi:hypothetical protein